MKSNRQARRLLGVSTNPINEGFRISNRRWLVFSANYPHVWEHATPSRRQRRAKRKVDDMRIERHFERNLKDGMTYTDAYAAAVRTVRGQHTQGERE